MKTRLLLAVIAALALAGCADLIAKPKPAPTILTLHVAAPGALDSAVNAPVILVQVQIDGTPVFREPGSAQTFALRPGPGFALDQHTFLRVVSTDPLAQTATVEIRRIGDGA